MAQIFISHSAKDKELINFLSNAGASTKVKLVFEEFEKLVVGPVGSDKIKQDIHSSNAVFIVLSRNVDQTPYTRDWVVWESGIASSSNKDVWIIEEAPEIGQLSIVIPHLRHFVILLRNDNFLSYMIKILESYDDSHVLGTIAAGAGAGAFLGGAGALVGAVAGLIMSDKTKNRPTGITIKCVQCSSSYQLHYPEGLQYFRCPVCNLSLRFNQ
jgi:hypothetical protein